MTPSFDVGFCKFPILKTGGQVPGRIGEYRGKISGFWSPGWRKSAKKCEERRFIPPRKGQRGPLLFWLFYRGICPSDIKQACVFQKGPRGSAIFFISLQQKISAFHRGIFCATKTKIPPRKCQFWTQKRGPAAGKSLIKIYDPKLRAICAISRDLSATREPRSDLPFTRASPGLRL